MKRRAKTLRTVTLFAVGASVCAAPLLAAPGPVTEPGTAVLRASAPNVAPAAALTGSVSGEANGIGAPLAAAGVYAYRLADLSLRKVLTDEGGHFAFSSLPAGLYKIIAHKPGFVPAVVMLTRATSTAFQQLELQLAAETFDDASDPGDFWTIRQRIPRDVLREIVIANAAEAAASPAGATELRSDRLEAEMQALTGVGHYGGSARPAELRGGEVDLKGRLGALELALEGEFQQLEGSEKDTATRLGQSSSVALELEAPHDSVLRLGGRQGELLREDGPIDFERYDLSWRRDVGPGTSEVRAQFVSESNFYRDPRFGQLDVPKSTETLELRGSYETPVGRRASIETGVAYRERRAGLFGSRGVRGALLLPEERIDLFGVGELELQPALSLRYGLVTTVLDGSVAMTPQIGLNAALGSSWSAEAEARYRLADPEAAIADFLPVYYGVLTDCTPAESACFKVRLSRAFGKDGELTIAGLQREYGDTVRVYFSEDFFDQLESLFFVRGDNLPELQLVLSHRLSPSILARFRSNIAQGGGGVLSGAGQSYGNELAYLVTSIATHFESTQTDIELAYRSVEQSMRPLSPGTSAFDLTPATAIEQDRLRLMLTQNLRSLLGFASDWAVLLDLQVSRGGALPYATLDDELRRRVVGGLAVRF